MKIIIFILIIQIFNVHLLIIDKRTGFSILDSFERCDLQEYGTFEYSRPIATGSFYKCSNNSEIIGCKMYLSFLPSFIYHPAIIITLETIGKNLGMNDKTKQTVIDILAFYNSVWYSDFIFAIYDSKSEKAQLYIETYYYGKISRIYKGLINIRKEDFAIYKYILSKNLIKL